MLGIIVLLVISLRSLTIDGLTMVVVPAVFNETNEIERKESVSWLNDNLILQKYNFTISHYQRLYPQKPNYVNNQGSEAGVYLRYIVDHYDNFPDLAVFVHAAPHTEKWPAILGCIRPNATFSFLNPNRKSYMKRDTHYKEWYYRSLIFLH